MTPARIPEAVVERVARRLCVYQGSDPDAVGPGKRRVVEIDGISTLVSDHQGPLWRMWIGAAEHMLAEVWPTIEAAHDLVALWQAQKIEGVSRADRNAAIESSRQGLIEALPTLGLGDIHE